MPDREDDNTLFGKMKEGLHSLENAILGSLPGKAPVKSEVARVESGGSSPVYKQVVIIKPTVDQSDFGVS